jgi:Mce-associated membrane protein
MTTPADVPPAPLEEGAKPLRRRRGVATLVALVAAALSALGLTAWLHGKARALTGSAAASNVALVDAGTTAQVCGQVRDAVQRIFSYDFTRLDADERAAAEVITGPFVPNFHQQFARVRQLAPPQQARVVAAVPALAVKALRGDRATVLVFLDQQAHQGGQAAPLHASGRLAVTAQRVNGHWKIADAEPF